MNKLLLISLLVLGDCATGNTNHKYTSQYSGNTLQLGELVIKLEAERI